MHTYFQISISTHKQAPVDNVYVLDHRNLPNKANKYNERSHLRCYSYSCKAHFYFRSASIWHPHHPLPWKAILLFIWIYTRLSSILWPFPVLAATGCRQPRLLFQGFLALLHLLHGSSILPYHIRCKCWNGSITDNACPHSEGLWEYSCIMKNRSLKRPRLYQGIYVTFICLEISN